MVPVEPAGTASPEQYPFRDPSVASELARRGYAVVTFLGADELEAVRRVRATYGPPPDDPRTGFFSDAWSHDHTYRQAVDTALRELLGPPLARLTDQHRVLAVAHLVKWPTDGSAVTPHRDPSFVDERLFRSVTVWCPVTTATATLVVVDGSHLHARPSRPHDAADNLAPEVWESADVATTVEVEPGAAIVFDHRLIHGSVANTGELERTTVAALLTPSAAVPEYSFLTDGAIVEVVAVGPAFFRDHPFQALDVERILASYPRVRSEPTTSALTTLGTRAGGPASAGLVGES
jgi:hypothetical protein